jgi:hypothetical protein
LLGNDCEINIQQSLLSNDFANKHVSMANVSLEQTNAVLCVVRADILQERQFSEVEPNPAPWGKTGHPVPRGYIYEDLALQVWGVENLRQ